MATPNICGTCGRSRAIDGDCACADGPARHLITESVARGGHCWRCGLEFEHDHGTPTICDDCWTPTDAGQGYRRAYYSVFVY